MCIPTAIKENIVTERTTEGENPATKAKHHKTKTMVITFNKRYRFVLGRKFRKKFKNNNTKPTCKPETDKI